MVGCVCMVGESEAPSLEDQQPGPAGGGGGASPPGLRPNQVPPRGQGGHPQD